MIKILPFEFQRKKGIVWVCDISQSSEYLNDNSLVSDIEAFIPRLYFVSKLLVECYGGLFIKWHGDGFLAFFEMELDREKSEKAKLVFAAAWHLSFLCNNTQLNLNPKKKFQVRHGITYEKDGLWMTIQNEGTTTNDIIGRNVVLAFRLSSVFAVFPSIVTVKELVEKGNAKLEKWTPSKDEILKHFKGEKFGTDSIYKSSGRTRTRRSLTAARKRAEAIIIKVESGTNINASDPIYSFTLKMENGPDWCKHTIRQHSSFIKREVLEPMKILAELIKDSKQKPKTTK